MTLLVLYNPRCYCEIGAPLLLWSLPSRDIANQALLIKKLIAETSQIIQITHSNSAFGMAPPPAPVIRSGPPAPVVRTAAGRLFPKKFMVDESSKSMAVDRTEEMEVCMLKAVAAAGGKKSVVNIIPIESAATAAATTLSTTFSATSARVSPECNEAPVVFPATVISAAAAAVSVSVPEAPIHLSAAAMTDPNLHDEEIDSALAVLCNLAASSSCMAGAGAKSQKVVRKPTNRVNASSFMAMPSSSPPRSSECAAAAAVTSKSGPLQFEDLIVSYEALKEHAPSSVNGGHVQLSYQAALLRKLESLYNELIHCEAANGKNRAPMFLDSGGRCTLPIPLDNGSVIRVNKDDVKQWIEKILRQYTGDK